jgi:hypothetical protein
MGNLNTFTVVALPVNADKLGVYSECNAEQNMKRE